MDFKLFLWLMIGFIIIIGLIIVPLFLKVKNLKKSLISTKKAKDKIYSNHSKMLEERKLWETELSNIIRKLVGNTGFNQNLYIGAFLAWNRGLNLQGLEEWLKDPKKDSMYNKLNEVLMNTIPQRETLYGYNEFDNVARVLCASVHRTKKFSDMICSSFGFNDIITIFDYIKEKGKLQHVAVILKYIDKRIEVSTNGDDENRFRSIIKSFLDTQTYSDIEASEIEIDNNKIDVYKYFEAVNIKLIEYIILLLEQDKIKLAK